MLQEEKHEWIGAYVDGELSPSDQRLVEQWLEAEPECRQLHDELMDLRRQLHQVRIVGPDAQLGQDMAAAIMAEIGTAQPEWHPRATPEEAAPHTGWGHVGGRLLALAAAVSLMVFWAIRVANHEDPALAHRGQIHRSTEPGAPSEGESGAEAYPPSEMFVAARPASFIVVEIELTEKGLTRDSVNSALRQAGIGVANGVPVAADLESALMESRFFNPPPDSKKVDPSREANAGRPALQPKVVAPAGGNEEGQPVLHEMIYCVLNGPQLDTVWEYIAAEKGAGAVIQFQMDVAFLENDLSLFQMLHSSAELQLASAERSGKARDSLRLRAQRVLLTTAMQTKLGLGLRALSAPTIGLLGSVLKRQPGEGEGVAADGDDNRNQAFDEEAAANVQVVASEAQRREMASKSTGILFVVRSRKPIASE